VRLGGKHHYLEKDSQLEDLLVRDRFPELHVEARGATPVKLTETRYGRFTRALAEFEGWTARLRSDFGPAASDFVIRHGLLETEAASPEDAVRALAGSEQNGYALESTAVGDELRVRVVEVQTNATSDVVVPATLLQSPIYAHASRMYRRLGEILGGLPPFTIVLGRQRREAGTFAELRDGALELSKHGMQITRFKGLSEMNAGELRTTTMDHARRMLIRVDVEDAAAADLWFSRLMGDEVEPRRLFIEQNALDVKNLDI